MTIIRAGTTSTTKLSIEVDDSDTLTFASGQTNAMSIGNTGINIESNEFIVPVGNTSTRPASPETGEIRFNTETGKLEGYEGTEWVNIEP